MGNTQHSLLSGQIYNTLTERNKSSSPFTNRRDLLTSKSPEREDHNQDKQQITSPTFAYHSENKPSVSQKNKLKNTLAAMIAPIQNTSPKKVQTFETRQDSEMKPKAHFLKQFSSYINKFSDEYKAGAKQFTEQSFYPKSTKSENKRFTFDEQNNYAMQQRGIRKSQAEYELDQQDTWIKIFYDKGRYVQVGWNSKNTNVNIGWLISEALRKLSMEEDYNKRTQIIGLKNTNNKISECYDQMLTQLDSPLTFIKNGDMLSIISPPERSTIGSNSNYNSNFSPIIGDKEFSQGSSLTLEDFDLIKVIGKGGFSKVFQVRKKDTGKLYAMKTLSKAKIKRDNKVENILNERAILEKVSNPFIIQMKYAFQNEDYLFLILEFCAGGELFYRLNNIPNGKMSEKQAKFYFAEILEALQYLHDNDILYRDLKPENIVLDEHGHVKITDFGLSKVDFKGEDRAYSFCGSPEYMAPEMLATERHRMLGNTPLYHNKSLDFYHLGALLFEMLNGLPPFFSENREKMYKDILFSPITIPQHFSPECRTLLKGLLQKNPSKRIGSQRGAIEIKEHPWCKDISWKKIGKKQVIPPFKPFWNKSNFDPEYTSMNPILEDDEPLVALQDLDEEQQMKNQGEFLDDYENRISKAQMVRQHSIEFYQRENNTFRGYSFLEQSNNNNQNLGNGVGGGNEGDPGFFFCLADSKDNSFGLGTSVDQYPEEFQGNEEFMMMMFNNSSSGAVQNKNKQSHLSILSEGNESLQNNVQLIGDGIESLAGDSPLKVMVESNYNMSTNPNEKQQLIPQQSKESLYNELLSTFDYSVHKKDKNIDNSKRTGNQTQSTMSLFSNPQNQLSNIQVEDPSKKKQQPQNNNITTNKEDKNKIEFQKNNRKYSPDIDLSRLLQHTLSKQPSGIKYLQQQTAKDDKRPQSIIKGNNLIASTLGHHTKDKKSSSTLAQQEYQSVGSTFMQKKRGSDMAQIPGGTNQKPSPSTKSKLRGSTKKDNGNKTTFSSQSLLAGNYQMGMKTSHMYSQLNKKISGTNTNANKQRNASAKDKIKEESNNVSNSMISSNNNNTNYIMNNKQNPNEECKIESNYQTLHHQTSDDQVEYVVKKITTNEFLGSFITNNSNRNGQMSKNEQLINLNESDREAMTAIILNQSHESCCCSDDEYYSKGVSKQSQKELKKVQYNALQESIMANQSRHQANEMQFKEELQSMKYTVTDQRCTSFIHENHFSQGHLSPVQIETISQIKSNNPSMISQSPFDTQAHQNNNTTYLGNNPNKIIKKVGTSANIQRYNSPAASYSILNKTTPISPMRGGSRVKERPSINKQTGLIGVGQQQLSNTPKSKETKAQIQNRLAQTVGRIGKNQLKQNQ